MNALNITPKPKPVDKKPAQARLEQGVKTANSPSIQRIRSQYGGSDPNFEYTFGERHLTNDSFRIDDPFFEYVTTPDLSTITEIDIVMPYGDCENPILSVTLAAPE